MNPIKVKRAASLSMVLLISGFVTSQAEPVIKSDKVTKKERTENHESETILTIYEGGWRYFSQIIKYKDPKIGLAVFQDIYDPKGQLQCHYAYFKSQNPLTDKESFALLSDAFKTLTGEKYNSKEFELAGVDGKDALKVYLWNKQRDDGQKIYVYQKANSIACFTLKYLEATQKDLVHMVGLAPAE